MARISKKIKDELKKATGSDSILIVALPDSNSAQKPRVTIEGTAIWAMKPKPRKKPGRKPRPATSGPSW